MLQLTKDLQLCEVSNLSTNFIRRIKQERFEILGEKADEFRT